MLLCMNERQEVLRFFTRTWFQRSYHIFHLHVILICIHSLVNPSFHLFLILYENIVISAPWHSEGFDQLIHVSSCVSLSTFRPQLSLFHEKFLLGVMKHQFVMYCLCQSDCACCCKARIPLVASRYWWLMCPPKSLAWLLVNSTGVAIFWTAVEDIGEGRESGQSSRYLGRQLSGSRSSWAPARMLKSKHDKKYF